MSQYINFYIKAPGTETFLPIESYGRSSMIYCFGNAYAPFESGKPLTKAIIREIIDNIKFDIERNNQFIVEYNNKKNDVIVMNNSIEEKMEVLYDVYDALKEFTDKEAQLQYAKNFYNFLDDILFNAECSDKKYDENDYIYFGVEWSPDYDEE